MPRTTSKASKPGPATNDAVTAIKHPAKRKNIPPAGLEAQGRIQETPRLRYEYNPHLPPVLRSATDATAADRLPELLATARQRALSEEESSMLAAALRRHEPWLVWSGKREKPWFEVEPVALHMHERVSTQAILRVLARQDVNRDLFADPQHDYAGESHDSRRLAASDGEPGSARGSRRPGADDLPRSALRHHVLIELSATARPA